MPRLLTPMLLLGLFLLLIVPVPTEAIQITGGSLGAFDILGFALSVGLRGQEGFSLRAIAGSDFWPHCQVHDSLRLDHRCSPGDVVVLDQTWMTEDRSSFSPGEATLRGATYFTRDVPAGGTAFAGGHFFTARTIVPPIETGPTFRLQQSFSFVGSLTYFDQDNEAKVEPLTGRGSLVFQLFQSPAGDGTLWELGELSYNFDPIAPTPEPGTLLLAGATAGGVGLVRRMRRRGSHGASDG